MERLPALEDPQLELTLLRACYGLPKFSFCLRTTEPTFSRKACIDFDYNQRSALSNILGSPIDDRTWAQASLPISLGGLGLRSASDHAAIAFDCSARQTTQLWSRARSHYVSVE